jgi:hypothetical protein
MTTAAFSRSTRAARRPWPWALALLALMLTAPVRADLACSGADAEVARPIAATLQAHASVFDLAGSFEVTLRSSPEPTSEIDLRHVMGKQGSFSNGHQSESRSRDRDCGTLAGEGRARLCALRHPRRFRLRRGLHLWVPLPERRCRLSHARRQRGGSSRPQDFC